METCEHEKRRNNIAIALNINFFRRMLNFHLPPLVIRSTSSLAVFIINAIYNKPSLLENSDLMAHHKVAVARGTASTRPLPLAPVRVLDAPNLRDDFYCSILAYSLNCQTLAVGLGNVLYTWSDKDGVRSVNGVNHDNIWLTSISFSSVEGNKDLLAAGRSNGTFIVMSLAEPRPRFEPHLPHSIACISWRPCSVLRFSSSPLSSNTLVATEDLIVGDEFGDLYYYIVEWPPNSGNMKDAWPGSISLVAKISLHSQQICGLAWSPNGDMFASGANDNLCALFEVNDILAPQDLGLHSQNLNTYHVCPRDMRSSPYQVHTVRGNPRFPIERMDYQDASPTIQADAANVLPNDVTNLISGYERQIWVHQAAVKAIAFCPWLEGLVATGGGSNDKRIHFFHTVSGSSLATIFVAAQVTSLIWSNTKREIAATFGYAHPEHPYRIAVFSWPDCSRIAAIPWEEDLRALHAIPYPCVPKRGKGPRTGSKVVHECIVVASSDKTVKFHEVWSTEGSKAVAKSSIFGGSDILEDLQGIMKEGDVIR